MTDGWLGQNLPVPLRDALTKFAEWLNCELLADQARSTPKGPLYHYTGEAAFRGILEHRRLWCFSHSQQTDDTEFRYSFDVARKIIRDEAARGILAVKSILQGLDAVLVNNPVGETFDFYFFSLSSHRDHAEQWAKYGDCRRGFALGFAPTLFQADRTELGPEPNEDVFVSQVIYGDAATSDRHRRAIRKLAEIVAHMQRVNPHLVCDQNQQLWFDKMNMTFVAMSLIWNCLTAKSEGYRDEQETRYIIMGECARFDDIRKQYDGRNYIRTPLPLSEHGNIVEIIVGPDAPSDAELMVTGLLRKFGYPCGIPIRRSTNAAMIG